MDKQLLSLFSSLSLTEQEDFFTRLGIIPRGTLYAYVIPLYGVHVQIVKLKRSGAIEYEYHSKDGDWVLVNMGMTTKRNPNDRLNYFKQFDEAFRPGKEHMIYCCPADTSHEDAFRAACALGGWDIGGKTRANDAYFSTLEEWTDFLGVKRCGPTECVVIPRNAIPRIKKRVDKIRYPRTAELCTQIEAIIKDETLKLLKLESVTDKRDYICTLQLERKLKEKGPSKSFPFSF